jgi:glutamate formiminotransferase/formiminotetrahydrofolate cyclodeaminase
LKYFILPGGKMSTSLVECVPNFSEGRKLEVVEKIVAAISAVEDVVLLDYSSDADHNRSVVTFVGPLEAVEQAAFEGIKRAAELINLDHHSGEHPRIGATDVVPLIPISGVSMAECVEAAQRLGKRVGEELLIPVYLYENAATSPDRVSLGVLRKGGFEGLKEEIKTNPDRRPDFGPGELGPAGATVIGARSFLIAYNVYLDTEDVTVAEKIGKSMRHISGGFRYVKGLGMLVDGKAQVSMNLTNFKRTPVFRVVEAIRREAARYGANITHSELIGLIPQQALIDSAVWYLQLDDFSETQILEHQIQTKMRMQTQDGVDGSFLVDLAAGTPTPGGGSAAAYSAAMAAGLVGMVARITIGKKKYADVEEKMIEIASKADSLREELHDSVAVDSAAFEAVMAAYALPKADDQQKAHRLEAIQEATLHAAQVPLSVAQKSVQVLALAAQTAELGNVNAITDAGTAAALAQAALTGASMNVRINLGGLKDENTVREMREDVDGLKKKAAGLIATVEHAISLRGKIEF